MAQAPLAAGQVTAADMVAPELEARPVAGLWSDALARVRRDRLTAVAALVLLLFVVLALAADVLAARFFHYGFSQQDLLNTYAKPELRNPAFWLGGDDIGRSQIVRLLYGARVSLAVGFGAALINLSVGIGVGLAAGYFRGWLDDVIQWLIGTLEAIPRLFLLLIAAVLFRPGPVPLVLLLGLLSWPSVALFVRGQTLSLREREFVLAGRVSGASSGRLMFGHILPNVLPLVFAISAIDVGSIILVES